MKRCVLSSIPDTYSPKVVEDTGDVVLSMLEGDVDLAILDLDMKGELGLKTIDIIKKSRAGIPLVVISGDPSITTGRRVMEKGVFYYLLKPLNKREVKEVIKSALKCERRKNGFGE